MQKEPKVIRSIIATFRINLSDEPAGVYFISIRSDNHSATEKVFLIH